MSLNLFKHVLIKNLCITGRIVDIYFNDHKQAVYVVQCDKPCDSRIAKNGYFGEYPLFDCSKDELVEL